jgi:hypothetical protein
LYTKWGLTGFIFYQLENQNKDSTFVTELLGDARENSIGKAFTSIC